MEKSCRKCTPIRWPLTGHFSGCKTSYASQFMTSWIISLSFVLLTSMERKGKNTKNDNEKNFLDEIKSTFHIFEGLSFGGKINNSDSSFKKKIHTKHSPMVFWEIVNKYSVTLFSTSHGKGCFDGVGGTINTLVAQKFLQQKAIVKGAESFYHSTKENKTSSSNT